MLEIWRDKLYIGIGTHQFCSKNLGETRGLFWGRVPCASRQHGELFNHTFYDERLFVTWIICVIRMYSFCRPTEVATHSTLVKWRAIEQRAVRSLYWIKAPVCCYNYKRTCVAVFSSGVNTLKLCRLGI
jgi:hypothetical protein